MLSMAKAQLGILVGPKGRGSNMAAIARACASGAVDAQVRVVVAYGPSAPAVAVARELGLYVAFADPKEPAYAETLLESLAECDVVCLAGYLRLLPNEVLEAFPGRVLNIHPALLPKFGGKGMYGHHVHEAVLAAGETESGCTVHCVTPHYDEGEVLVQLRCPIEPNDTPDTLAARVLALEHQAYPLGIQRLIESR